VRELHRARGAPEPRTEDAQRVEGASGDLRWRKARNCRQGARRSILARLPGERQRRTLPIGLPNQLLQASVEFTNRVAGKGVPRPSRLQLVHQHPLRTRHQLKCRRGELGTYLRPCPPKQERPYDTFGKRRRWVNLDPKGIRSTALVHKQQSISRVLAHKELGHPKPPDRVEHGADWLVEHLLPLEPALYNQLRFGNPLGKRHRIEQALGNRVHCGSETKE
jgi:hypothetical protein